MAPGTAAYALQLKPGKSVRLTGMFDEHREVSPIVWLSNCRPAQ